MLALSKADVCTLSLGDVGQYSATLVWLQIMDSHKKGSLRLLYHCQTTTPTTTGSRVIFSDAAGPDGGVDVILSKDLQANLNTVIDNNCKTIDNGCIESVRSSLISPETELESRQLVAAAAYGVGALIGLVSLTIPLWEDRNHGIPAALHIPQAHISPAVSAASAATMAAMTDTGAPFVTVTPRPNITPTTGYE